MLHPAQQLENVLNGMECPCFWYQSSVWGDRHYYMIPLGYFSIDIEALLDCDLAGLAGAIATHYYTR